MSPDFKPLKQKRNEMLGVGSIISQFNEQAIVVSRDLRNFVRTAHLYLRYLIQLTKVARDATVEELGQADRCRLSAVMQ